ncbi:PLP-dependent aminotransferase family protein [Streptomyces sp. A7024]|uniref:PLP-dependent aminotransferase family protein n=1 Tax=Streptomyces coryli TaxID=1128680 RepID=A0A6G4TSH2_9ACTN|nr:PLP-dependent aminotransferase family protein [Streptomyces coryli]NGN62804.1 PLP-dependent aminotransferase family protein [Streptomyces coryli]
MTLSGTNSAAEKAETPGWTAAWELLLPAAAAPARRRGQTLQAALRDAVRSGRLAAGTRLPASRELAADLGVSRGLVTDAYEQLTAEGYLRAGRGSGTWVSEIAGAAPAPAAPAPGPAPALSFKPGTPDLSLFPRATWGAAQRRVLSELPHGGLGYPDPRGLPRLRTALAALLARRRGVVADPERVLVCSGVSQALTLTGMVMRARGHRTMALEDPGSPPHGLQFEATGIAATSVAIDAEGIDLRALRRSGARIAVLTPSHQFPSGIAYSPERRAGLLQWLREGEHLVVEDDYDGEFRYDREPVGALQGLDPERVLYTGSVSKSLAPGLRLGWMVAPSWLAAELAERKFRLDLGNSVLDQAAFADLVERGEYDRHLRRTRREYKTRRDTLVAALAEHFPGAEVSGIAAGLHVIAALPEGYGPEREFTARALRAGVEVLGLSSYGSASADDPRVRLVLGYAHLAPSDIARGVERLRTASGTRVRND